MRLRASLVLLLLLLGCGGDAGTPEERVRAVLAELEANAESHDVDAMKKLVSEEYVDEYGNDRQAVGAIVGFHLLRNQSVHLLVRVTSVELPAPGEARVQALVAMAGTPIDDLELLPTLNADLYRFTLGLREEDGEYRVGSARWQPATLADFHGG